MRAYKFYVSLLVLFLAVEIGHSFLQYFHAPLDGDLASIVVPSEHYEAVLDAPFGSKAIRQDTSYAATNRHFVHLAMYHYFRVMPAVWNTVATPVQSIYLSTALFKLMVHLLLLAILGCYVLGRDALWSKKGLLVLALIAPLFQSGGSYYHLMGVIDKSPTYAFFYTAPLLLLLLFYYPVYQALVWRKNISIRWWQWIGLCVLVLILPFSGPLIPAVCLVTSASMTVGYVFWEKEKLQAWLKILPLPYWGAIVVVNVLSLYSLYLGSYNVEQSLEMPLGARYQLLGKGLIHQFTNKLGPVALLLMVGINVVALWKLPLRKEGETVKLIAKWILVFTFLYLMLLPFGGYRSYRPLIVRRDTLLPVLLLLFFFWGISTSCILAYLKQHVRKLYIVFIVASLALFQLADEPEYKANECERAALDSLQQSDEQAVAITDACNVLSWEKIETAGQSEVQSELLKIWGILSEGQSYYQPKDKN
jgi:hypothetical protein